MHSESVATCPFPSHPVSHLGFKPIDDVLGHAQGDLVLRIVAQRLTRAVGERDVVARIGGDEFIVVMRYLESEVQCLGVLKVLGEPIALIECSVAVSASPRVTLVSATDPADVQSLMRAADEAMYQAKASGKNRMRVATWGE